MIYIILIIILILMLMPIKVVVNKDDFASNVDIYFTKIFNMRLDFDQLLRRLFSERGDPNKITLRSITSSIRLYDKAKGILKTNAKMIKIRKLTFIIKTKSQSLEGDTWGFVFSWVIFGVFQNYIHGIFKEVVNEYYNHQVFPENKINFECHFNIRPIYFLFALVRNIKDIPGVLKTLRKGRQTYGASNF